MSKSYNWGERNGQWRGDKASPNSIHRWVKKRLEKPLHCQECKKVPPYDLAFVDMTAGKNNPIWTRELDKWLWLCRRCHMTKDGRLSVMLKFNKELKIGEKNHMYGKRHTEESKQKMSQSLKKLYRGKKKLVI